MVDAVRNVDPDAVPGRRQGIAAVNLPGRAKNDDAQPPAQADDALVLGRIEVAVRRHVGTRLDGIEQAMAGIVVGRMEIEILAQARRLPRFGAKFGKQGLVDDGDH